MIRTPQATLPPDAEVEVIVRISLSGHLLGEGTMTLDTEGSNSIEFKSAGLAAQSGVYEVLRAIWPEELDIPRRPRKMPTLKE